MIREKLKIEFPDLFPKNKDDYYNYPRTEFLNDLRTTVKAPAPKPGSIEDLINQVAADDTPSHMREADHPIFRIYLQGTATIPELVRLSTSRKLTPAIQAAFMNAREKRLRLGHLASGILEDMTGTLSPGKTGNSFHRF